MKTTTLFEDKLAPNKDQLLHHALYHKLNSTEAIKTFMEYHVFAVWDFMSLVKALQRKLTCTDLPWVPVGSPSTRRLINEIVWGEESDVDQFNQPGSHFELYLKAMEEIGANTAPINALVSAIQNGTPWRTALSEAAIPNEIKSFIDFSLTTATQAPVHVVASVFTYGREDLIPDLFIAIIKEMAQEKGSGYDTLVYYFERHIEVDSEEHGPMAQQMIQELCGDNTQLWEQANDAAQEALQKRLSLWDFIESKI
ncbi:MAG: DUF3050 domain-containing protein [Flavobacteriaceae bacterium]|jgi:hypothetical protein|nr:DUF3050 domain-containing protein [Flavobacteriaceae bacterium]